MPSVINVKVAGGVSPTTAHHSRSFHSCATASGARSAGALRRAKWVPGDTERQGGANSLRGWSQAWSGAGRLQRLHKARRANASSAQAAGDAGASADTLTVRLYTEEARKTILLDQYDNGDGTFDVYIGGVVTGSNADDDGLQPGQVVRAVSDPIEKDQMWVLSQKERLRFVKDAINTTRAYEITLVVDKMPTITAEMVAGPQPEEEEEEVVVAAPPPVQPPPMSQGQMERPDLYSKDWEGDQYVGSAWNELTIGLAIAVLVPVLGLVFALATRGTLWDTYPY